MDVVDRVMTTFTMMRDLDDDAIAQSRQRLSKYMEKLKSAGRTDEIELAVYGLAYLRESQDGPSARFTGC